MTDLWSQILTAATALTGSLGAVFLTQRHQRAMANEDRVDKRRQEIRGPVADFLRWATEWHRSYSTLIPMIRKFSERDFSEFANTETGVRLSEVNQSVERELFSLLTLIGDPELKASLNHFHALWMARSEQMMGPLFDKKMDDTEALRASFRYLGLLHAQLLAFGNGASSLLNVRIGDGQ